MSTTRSMQTPLTNELLEKVRIGDKLSITGILYTGRDAAHKRLVALLQKNEPLPFDLQGQIMFYVGPSPAPPGKPIGSAGPTTSYRMDPYAPMLLNAGLKAMIGKGPRSQPVIESMKKNKAVYLAAIGGAGVIAAEAIKKAEIIAYEDLGTEAIHKLHIENFPCIVANDIHGNDLYNEGIKQYQRQ